MKGTKCIDIDECLYNLCPPDYDCVNSMGSYFCNCLNGFAYHKDTQERVQNELCHVNPYCLILENSSR